MESRNDPSPAGPARGFYWRLSKKRGTRISVPGVRFRFRFPNPKCIFSYMTLPLTKLPESIRRILENVPVPSGKFCFIVYGNDGTILHYTGHPKILIDWDIPP